MSLGALGSRWTDVERDFTPSAIEPAALRRLKLEDPSDNHKYLRWMALQAHREAQARSGVDVYDILRLVHLFHRFRKRVQPRDLYKFKDVQSLARALKSVVRHRSVKLKHGAELVYDSSDFIVLWVPTQAARVYYGRGTKWCIAGKDARSAFTAYSVDNRTFYYALHRRLPSSNEFYKTAWAIGRGKDSDELRFTTATDRSLFNQEEYWLGLVGAVATLATDEHPADVEQEVYQEFLDIKELIQLHARKLPDSIEHRLLYQMKAAEVLEAIEREPELALVPVTQGNDNEFLTKHGRGILFYLARSPFKDVREWVRRLSSDFGTWRESFAASNIYEQELRAAVIVLDRYMRRDPGFFGNRHWDLILKHPEFKNMKASHAYDLAVEHRMYLRNRDVSRGR